MICNVSIVLWNITTNNPHSGPTKQGFTQSRINSALRAHHHTPARAAPGPPGTAVLIQYFVKASQPDEKMLSVCVFPSVAHQNGGLKNHAANERNSRHHNNQRPPSGNTTRPFLPANVSQLKERSNRHAPQQPNLDILKVPDPGAAGWDARNYTFEITGEHFKTFVLLQDKD